MNSADDTYIGSGGFFVCRSSGEIWQLGSGMIASEGVEYWLEYLAQGWKLGSYRLTIQDTSQPLLLARFLYKLNLEYVVLELEDKIVWQTRKIYTLDVIRDRLSNLPCSFTIDGQKLRGAVPELDRLAAYVYSPIEGPPQYDWRSEGYSESDLGPQWD